MIFIRTPEPGCIRARPRRSAPFHAILAAVLLSGCVTNPLADAFTTTTTESKPITSQAPAQNGKRPNSFAEFSDIPIPVDASMDLGQTLVLGDKEGWIGRLSLDVGHGMTDMYAFYEQEMPRFGWEQITTVRARISTMTYQRGHRVATVTLQSTLTNGTAVDFTVGPARTSRSVATGG